MGAQKAMNIASNFFPLKNKISDTIIMDMTTNSIRQFIAPTRSIKFLIIAMIQILVKGIKLLFSKLRFH